MQLDKYHIQLTQLKVRSREIHDLQDLFELPITRHTNLLEMNSYLCLLKFIWDLVILVDSLFTSWKQTLWADINTDSLIEQVKILQSQCQNISKQSLKCKEWSVYKRLELNISNMAKVLPLISELHCQAMRDRHWKQLIQMTSNNPASSGNISIGKGNSSFCLNDILKLGLENYSENVNDLVEIATKELKIENRLNQIEINWNKYTLNFTRHRDTDVFIISQPDEILDALEENHLHLQSMSGMGRYVDFFRDRVTNWQTLLGEVESTLKLLLTVQRQWGSLESIFLGSVDIRAQLPGKNSLFFEFYSIIRCLI